MPTYVYSPVQSKRSKNIHRSKASSNVSNANTYEKNSRTTQKSLLSMYSNNKNNSRTLKYQTTAPSIVGKKYTQRPNGGYNLSYHLKNASVKTAVKPKLRFIQIAKLISPKLLK